MSTGHVSHVTSDVTITKISNDFGRFILKTFYNGEIGLFNLLNTYKQHEMAYISTFSPIRRWRRKISPTEFGHIQLVVIVNFLRPFFYDVCVYNIYSLHKTVHQAFCLKWWTRKRSSAITLPCQRRDYWRLVCFLWRLYRTLWDSYVSLWGCPTRRETTKNGCLRRRKVTMWDSDHSSGVDALRLRTRRMIRNFLM